MRPIALAAALLLAAAPHAPATAQSLAGLANRKAEQAQADKLEAKDRAVVEKAMMALAKGDLDPRAIAALQRGVDHVPPVWPIVQKLPDGDVMIHITDSSPTGTLSALLSATVAPGTSPGKSVLVAFNTYGRAALMLGSRAVGLRQPDEAIIWLDRGLAFQRDNLMLVTEKGMALALQRRFAEALTLYDAQPPQDPLAKPTDPNGVVRLQRARGYCLIELGRLDEAEAAYKTSLELEPDHGGAQHELAYIREARAGAPPQDVRIMTGAEAKARPAN